MSALLSQERNRQGTLNNAPVEATLIFGIPAVVALVCALALRNGAWFSGLWFIYSASRDVALVGVLLSIGVLATARKTVSEFMFVVMLASIAVAATLLAFAMRLEPYFR